MGISVACAGVSLGANLLPWQQANPPAGGEAGVGSAARPSGPCPQGRNLVLTSTSGGVGQ